MRDRPLADAFPVGDRLVHARLARTSSLSSELLKSAETAAHIPASFYCPCTVGTPRLRCRIPSHHAKTSGIAAGPCAFVFVLFG